MLLKVPVRHPKDSLRRAGTVRVRMRTRGVGRCLVGALSDFALLGAKGRSFLAPLPLKRHLGRERRGRHGISE